MALQDSNSERRNLVVLSLSIIVFFLAEGTFINRNITLQVVNVTFGKPEVLKIFVWFFLAWFTFRYWLINQEKWKEGFYDELYNYTPEVFINRYLIKKFNLSGDYTNSYYPDKYWFLIEGHDGNNLCFKHIFKNDNGAQKTDQIKVKSVTDWLIICLCGVYMFFRRPSLSSYFFPYLLVIGAVILGVLNAL